VNRPVGMKLIQTSFGVPWNPEIMEYERQGHARLTVYAINTQVTCGFRVSGFGGPR